MGGLNREGEYLPSDRAVEDKSGEIVLQDNVPEFFEQIITRQPLFTNIEPPLYQWIDIDEYVFGNYGKDWAYGVLAFPAAGGVFGPIAQDNFKFALEHILQELNFALRHVDLTVNYTKLLLQMIYGHGELIHETQRCLREAPELQEYFTDLHHKMAEKAVGAAFDTGRRMLGGYLYNRYILTGGRHGTRVLKGPRRVWKYGDIAVSFSFNLLMTTLGAMIRNVWESSILVAETELHPNYEIRRNSVELPGISEMITEAITGASNSFNGELNNIDTIIALRNVAGQCVIVDEFEAALYREFYSNLIDAARGTLE